jgi:hypothetical protein
MVQSEINLFASIGPDISGGRGSVNLGETKGKVLGQISKQRKKGGIRTDCLVFSLRPRCLGGGFPVFSLVGMTVWLS